MPGKTGPPHDIYACYNCPKEIMWKCKHRRRAQTMSTLDQWTDKCLLMNSMHKSLKP